MEENKMENVVDVNGEATGAPDTADIKATDFVEPHGKARKALKWVLNGVAAAALFVVGLLTGKALDGKDEGDETKADDNGEESKE